MKLYNVKVCTKQEQVQIKLASSAQDMHISTANIHNNISKQIILINVSNETDCDSRLQFHNLINASHPVCIRIKLCSTSHFLVMNTRTPEMQLSVRKRCRSTLKFVTRHISSVTLILVFSVYVFQIVLFLPTSVTLQLINKQKSRL